MTSRALRSVLGTAALLCPLALAACGADGDSAGADGGRLQVAAAFYPLQYLTERVGGEHVEVTGLTAPGGEPHDLELSLRETAALSDADVAVYLGGFQPAVDDAVEQNGPERVLDVSDAADLKPREEPDDEHGEDHGDDHGEDHAEEHGGDQAEEHGGDQAEEHEEHDHGDLDPHFWLDPERMAQVADAIATELAAADPEHAEDYRDNLAAIESDLADLDRDYRTGLAECRTTTVVVSHDAFGYLERYGLEFAAIAGLSPESEPSPRHLAELQDLIADAGVTTVFSETLASPAMAESVARDLELETAVLDPVEGLTDDTAEEDYISLMRSNLEALRGAGSCA